jgi:iron complex transport system permease protein
MTMVLARSAPRRVVPPAAAIAIIALVAAILIGTSIGETTVPVQAVLGTLANRLFGAGHDVGALDEGIIWYYRLTRTLVAASCGAGLAVSGVVLQALLRNPLADPYILGISAGASSGAVAVVILGLGAGVVSVGLGAFAGALLAFVLVVMLAHASSNSGGMSDRSGQIILAGIAGSQLFNALTSFIITKSANSEQARGIMFWLLGNLSGVRWQDVALAVPVALASVLVCWGHARALDAFTFGSDSAASLGISVRRTKAILISLTALVTAVMVSIVGSIGFVGLVVPHAARFLVGGRHARLLPVSAVSGAIFLIVADVVSRTIIPGQVLPIGVITALVGAPVFAILLIRGRHAR